MAEGTPARVVFHAVAAKGVAPLDRASLQAPDAFLELSQTSSPSRLRSKTVKKSLNPVFEQWFLLEAKSKDELLTVELFHWTLFGENKSLGYATVGIGDVRERIELWLPFTARPGAKEGSATGELHCYLLPLLRAEDDASAVFLRHAAEVTPHQQPLAASHPPALTRETSAPLLPLKPLSLTASSASGSSAPSSSEPSSLAGSSSPDDLRSGSPASSPPVDRPAPPSGMHKRTPSVSQTAVPGSPSERFMRPSRSSSAISLETTRVRATDRLFSLFRRTQQPQQSHPESPQLRSGAKVHSRSQSIPVFALPFPRELENGELPLPGSPMSPLPPLPATGGTPRKSKSSRPGSTHMRKGSAPPGSLRAPHLRGLVDCFFIVGAADVLADFANIVSETMGDADQAAQRVIVDPFSTAYTGDILDVFPPNSWSDLNSSSWMFCMPEGLILARDVKPDPEIFPFVLTTENGSRKYATCLRVYEALDFETTAALSCKISSSSETPLVAFAPRCYCVLSSVPCFTFCREWLQAFYDASFGPQKSARFCLEACLSYLRSVPLPIPAGPPLRITFDSRPMSDVQFPPTEGLPLLDVPVVALLKALSIDSLITVLRCMLFEEKIVLLSRSKTLLTCVGETLNALFFPFKWSGIYAPILPRHLLEYMHSPTPFLVGLPMSYAHEIADLSQFVCVDLDTGVVNLRAEEGASPLPSLPHNLFEMLRSDLKPFALKNPEQMDGLEWQPWHGKQLTPEEVNTGVRAAFLRFFCFVLNNYRSCCFHVRVFERPVLELDLMRFLTTEGRASTPFYRELVRTQAFLAFIEAHKWPRENVFDELLANGFHLWRQSGSELAQHLRMSQSWNAVEPISVALKSTMPDGSEPCTVLHRRDSRHDLINPDVLSLVVLPPLVAHTDLPSPPRPSRPFSQSLQIDGAVQAERLRKEYHPEENATTENVVAAIVDNHLDQLTQESVTEFTRTLESVGGRTAFALALLERRGNADTPVRKLEPEPFQLLGDLTRSALRESASGGEFVTPQLLLEVSDVYFQLAKGASEFLWTRLHNLEIWESLEFWQTFFYTRANTLCWSLYAPSPLAMQERWHMLASDEKAKLATAETDAIWKLLSEFAFKMSSLNVSAPIVRKFSATMSNRTLLDDEHRRDYFVLVKNMSKLNDLDEMMVPPSRTPPPPQSSSSSSQQQQ